MKITKYLHSCLLVEEEDTTLLFDPGQYTYDAKVFDINSLQKLDYILITHEHFDHMSVPFLKELVAKFPDVQTITNQDVVTKLRPEGITAITRTPTFIKTEVVPHEDVVLNPPPANIQFRLFDKLTNPGDSHHVIKTTQTFVLPIQAPWGSFAAAMKLAVSLKPRYVLPVHDWHWKDEVRTAMYQRAEEYLRQLDITFISLETGKPVTL